MLVMKPALRHIWQIHFIRCVKYTYHILSKSPTSYLNNQAKGIGMFLYGGNPVSPMLKSHQAEAPFF